MCRVLEIGLLAGFLSALTPAWSQPVKTNAAVSAGPAQSAAPIDEPDARRTREELSRLLDHYPPSLRYVLSADPSLLNNQAFLAPYPGLINFLNAHPEVPRSPWFYVGTTFERGGFRPESGTAAERIWGHMLDQIVIFAGFGMAFGLLAWLTKTLIDYRRWNRLSKVQTEVHTKLLDRFSNNEDVLAYIKSPAGSRFLESAPIALDAGPRSIGAPLGRILWSVQAGVVLVAGGVGMIIVAGRVAEEAAQPMHALGTLGIALGLGFVISALVSYLISHRLGLIERHAPASRPEPPVSLA